VIHCNKCDLALSLELAEDLAMQGLLFRLHRPQEVDPLLLEQPKTVAACAGHPPGSVRPRYPDRPAADLTLSARGSHLWRSMPD
jgi:hypothetical protein